jgi:hypothetical protein
MPSSLPFSSRLIHILTALLLHSSKLKPPIKHSRQSIAWVLCPERQHRSRLFGEAAGKSLLYPSPACPLGACSSPELQHARSRCSPWALAVSLQRRRRRILQRHLRQRPHLLCWPCPYCHGHRSASTSASEWSAHCAHRATAARPGKVRAVLAGMEPLALQMIMGSGLDSVAERSSG